MSNLTQDDKLEIWRRQEGVSVTLNGKRAVISGYRNDFATVSQWPEGLSAEWAWETVERIIDKGGAFKY